MFLVILAHEFLACLDEWEARKAEEGALLKLSFRWITGARSILAIVSNERFGPKRLVRISNFLDKVEVSWVRKSGPPSNDFQDQFQCAE